MAKEREATGKLLVAKLNIQRMDLERKWSSYFKEAERKLRKAEQLMRDLKIARENLLKAQQRCREMEALLKKQQDGKTELENKINILQETLDAERAANELFRQQAAAKIEEMGCEIRRQHEQYIDVLQGKDDQIVLADNKTKELQVQLADRESVIRCLELEASDYKLDIERLQLQIELMVPKAEHQDLQQSLHQAELKITDLKQENHDL